MSVSAVMITSTATTPMTISNLDELSSIVNKRGIYRQLAKLTGISHWQIANVLKGKRGTSLVNASKIAEALGVSIDLLEQYIAAQIQVIDDK